MQCVNIQHNKASKFKKGCKFLYERADLNWNISHKEHLWRQKDCLEREKYGESEITQHIEVIFISIGTNIRRHERRLF